MHNLAKTPLTTFFFMTFTFTWLVMGIGVAENYGYFSLGIPYEPLMILAAWMPNLVAFFVLGCVMKEKRAVKNLVKGWLKWRFGFWWYVVALSPLILALPAIWLTRTFTDIPPGTGEPLTLGLFLGMILVNLLTGATGEELGWRGFALPRLQNKLGALGASIFLGVLWAFWHFPLWFVGLGHEAFPFWAFSATIIASSVIITWGCNNTRGSMVMASLLHLTLNISFAVISGFGQVPLGLAFPYIAGIYTLYAVIVISVFGGDKLILSANRRGSYPRQPGVV